MKLKALSAIIILYFSAFFSSCIERKFVIITKPANVHVYIDGEDAGWAVEKSAKDKDIGYLEVPFKHYGGREIVLTKKGFETRKEFIDPSEPWFEYFPIDFFTDVLNPFMISLDYTYRFDLRAYKPINAEKLYKNASEFRDLSAKNLKNPLTNN